MIENYAFEDCSGLTELRLPDTLTKIGSSAFEGCSGLTEVRLHVTLTKIEKYAFQNCSGLTELRLPDTLTEIGRGAFSGCSGLTELRLPDTLTEIGEYAFSRCSGLTELRLPETLTKIEQYAFQGCSGLTKLSLPGTLTKIGRGAFYDCSGLTELRLPGLIISLGFRAFENCTSLRLVTMHSVAQFELNRRGNSHQFKGCTSLTAVSAPTDVASRFTVNTFEDCGTPVSDLLAAATHDLQLWYYWSPQSHFRCSSVAKETVLTVMLFGYRLKNEDSDSDSAVVLPNEMWFSVLGFCTRHSLKAC